MADEPKPPSETHRQDREYERQYWEAILEEAKSGTNLSEALFVIVKLHQALVDGEQLDPTWDRWVSQWLHVADRVSADWERAANISVAPNVEYIRSRIKRD